MKMDGPRDTTGVAGGVAILSFQTTVGQRFEHLAEKRDWRVLECIFEAKNKSRRIPAWEGVRSRKLYGRHAATDRLDLA
jgi:hypothetical protein